MTRPRFARRLARAGGVVLLCGALGTGPVQAQAIQSTPLPPPPGTAPSLGDQPAPTQPAPSPPAPAQPTPAPPAQAPAQPAPPAATAPDAAPPAAPAPGTSEPLTPSQTEIGGPWEARSGFVLRALNKITAQPTELTGKVGETVRFGTLAITVKSCVARPATQQAGAAAYLEVTDTAKGADPATAFHGWMFSNFPALAMLQHPTYDLRVVACKP